jgi:hypothetical protein
MIYLAPIVSGASIEAAKWSAAQSLAADISTILLR